jgi:hypothetical protein
VVSGGLGLAGGKGREERFLEGFGCNRWMEGRVWETWMEGRA